MKWSKSSCVANFYITWWLPWKFPMISWFLASNVPIFPCAEWLPPHPRGCRGWVRSLTAICREGCEFSGLCLLASGYSCILNLSNLMWTLKYQLPVILTSKGKLYWLRFSPFGSAVQSLKALGFCFAFCPFFWSFKLENISISDQVLMLLDV